MQRPVAGEPRGPGVRGDRLADSVRPRGDELGHRCRAAEPAELALDLAAEPLDHADLARAVFALGDLERLGRLAGQRVPARARDERLAARRARRSARIRRRSGSSSERTSSSRSSGARAAALLQQLGLAEQQREHGQALLALRAERAQVAAGREDAEVVEVRPERPSRRARDRGRARRSSSSAARGLALVAQLGLRQAQLPARSAKARLQRGDRLVPAGHELGGERGSPARSRARAPPVRRRPARPAAARRSAARPRRRTRPRGRARLGASRPSTRSKYARRAAGPPLTTTSRSGVKTSVVTSPRSCSAARSRAPFSVARLPLPSSSVTSSSSGTPARSPRRATRAASRAEAHQLRVGPRPRREALRADVQRLEQVRLAGAVRTGHEHEARLELQVELRVRAVVPRAPATISCD